MRAKVAAALFCAILLSSWNHGSAPPSGTFFVSPTGSDSNNGTSSSTPWQTIAKVNSSSFSCPSSVLFQGGQSFSGSIVVPASCSAGSPFTVSSYGAGRATINSGVSSGLVGQNKAGVVVSNLIFVGSGGTTNMGVHFDNSQAGNTKLDGPQISNLDVSGYGSNGVAITGSNGTSGFKNVLISGVVSHGNTIADTTAAVPVGTAGINVYSSPGYGAGITSPSHTNVQITNCTANGNLGVAGASNWTGSGIVIGQSSNSSIKFSVAHDNGSLADASNGPVGIWTFDGTGISIQFNESYANSSANNDGGGFDLDGGLTNSDLSYNYSHDNKRYGYYMFAFNDGSLTTWNNNTVRYNISQNDDSGDPVFGAYTISATSTMTNVFMYGNTCYGNNNTLCLRLAGGMTGYVANNIFYTSSTLLWSSGNPSISVLKNDYFPTGSFLVQWFGTNYTTLAGFEAGTGQEKIAGSGVGLNVDPKLTSPGGGGTTNGYNPGSLSAYTLQAGSPMIGVGLDLTQAPYNLTVGAQDYYGNTIPTGVGTGYNVGAY